MHRQASTLEFKAIRTRLTLNSTSKKIFHVLYNFYSTVFCTRSPLYLITHYFILFYITITFYFYYSIIIYNHFLLFTSQHPLFLSLSSPHDTVATTFGVLLFDL
jgi:hypothetical protein